MNALSAYVPVDLYTGSRSRFLDNIRVHAGVDYYTDMNKVFHLSRINLNITLPSIESGLPQRIFDIMGIGGFCLTNAQPEVGELFEIGKEIEVFHNVDECVEKTLYYLSHEQERQQIAIRGYQRICADYTYDKRVAQMLAIADADTNADPETSQKEYTQ